MPSETGHKLDSVVQGKPLGAAPDTPTGTLPDKKKKAPKIIFGDVHSETGAPKEQTIKLDSTVERPNVGRRGSFEQKRYERWKANRERRGLGTK